ncbi:MAG: CRP/FNR family cyclic AMP-dependent transcriptional regulator [Gammaproteobacteria bacterium]|jgi:CRP/FNR family cyclic AMP-dependent transcriptional regulator
MRTPDIESLRDTALFGALSEDALAFLVAKASHAERAHGEVFFEQGALGESMFLLLSGEVYVQRHTVDTAHTLTRLSPGACFGEMALIECAPRSATVRAKGNAKALEVSFARFHELYQHAPEQFVIVHMNMAREVCRRLRVAVELIAETKTQLETLNDYGLYM